MKLHRLIPLLALAFGLASCGGGTTDSDFSPRTLNLVFGANFGGITRGFDTATLEPASRLFSELTSVAGLPDGSAVVIGRRGPFTPLLEKVDLKGGITLMSPAPWEAAAPGCTPMALLCFPIVLAIAADSAGNVYGLQTRPHSPQTGTPFVPVTPLLYRFGKDVTRIPAPAEVPFHAQIFAADSAGNLYGFGDSNYFGDGTRVLRKLAPDNSVSAIAGGVFGNVDGQGEAARFSSPAGMAIDAAGNLYVTDNQTVRKITAAGMVTTIAGVAGQAGAADGNGPAARFYGPRGIAVDARGNLYVADTGNRAVRRITPAGDVSTVVGSLGAPIQQTLGDLPARLSGPTAVAVIPQGLLLTDGSALLLATIPFD